ncbi:MAG: hypothetical protein K1V78_00545 [Muribaculaceae bacterium]
MNIYTPDDINRILLATIGDGTAEAGTPTAVRREEFIQSVGSATAEALISEKKRSART